MRHVKVFFKCSHFLKKRGGRFAFFSKLSSSFSCGNSDLLLRFFFVFKKQKKIVMICQGLLCRIDNRKATKKALFAIGERGSFFAQSKKKNKKSFAYDLNNKRERGIVHSRAGSTAQNKQKNQIAKTKKHFVFGFLFLVFFCVFCDLLRFSPFN